jgi:hypothetical protein
MGHGGPAGPRVRCTPMLMVVFDRIRTRVLPALFTALGVMLVTAGLLTYTDTATAGPPPNEQGTVDVSTASPGASGSVSPSGGPSAPTASGSGAAASPSSSGKVSHVATRVVVPALDIDLPVVKDPGVYPYCNVAMYLKDLGQPGDPGPTYLFAHARKGMFLPLLVTPAQDMKNMTVDVYTSDDMLFVYEISKVRRHITTLDEAYASKDELLWLQTSEGHGIPQKTQVIATPLSSGPAEHAAANPKPHPVNCE